MRWLFILLVLLGKQHSYSQSNFIVPQNISREIAAAYNEGKEILEEKFSVLPDKDNVPALYLYNYEGGGSIIISADFRLEPILAQLDKGRIGEGDIPIGLLNWILTTVENIEFIREGKIRNTQMGLEGWQNLFESLNVTSSDFQKLIIRELPQSNCDPKGFIKTIAGPLLQTEWGQGCSYNEALPTMGCNSSCDVPLHPLTGCVATSLSQIACYYKSPLGFDYSSMPLYWGDEGVQKLMRFSSFAVQSTLGCASSTALFSSIVPALKNAFKYESASFSVYGNDGLKTIKEEIQNKRPVILGACSEKKSFLWWSIVSDCHAWICDGIKTLSTSCASYLWLHMNWGWNELGATSNYNGWYSYNHWQVEGRKYQYMKEMVLAIKP